MSISQSLLTYEQAKQAVADGKKISSTRWNDCKFIRLPEESDHEYLHIDSLDGLIMEDCNKKVCDCRIGIWVQTPEDQQASDYFVTE